MLLFLDVISPIPEFFVIEDNKVIIRQKIVKNINDKLSDNIFESYSIINKNLNMAQNINKIAMTIGPGSYTSLRVGAAFVSAIIISKNLLFCPLTIEDFFKFKSDFHSPEEYAIYISSTQNQNYLCTINEEKKIVYNKLENNDYNLPNKIKKIFYNSKKFNTNDKSITQHKFSIINDIIRFNKKLLFKNNLIVKPIYFSNNDLLN